ncbi:MAG: hypothetical protein GWM98_29765, partial [Nitrospinaceae bacterium]|nr:hypothetical protein [Nitrospinaceae bacterium]NIR57884.1 hypothetical protein [Nitrospinaceae bacterium]NIS88342.1 hypothetical protein [Nitrospinaceae bacterium]NIT85220.1 hypothetical protein [Nitrospinaceae bacterium]NIU47373.1 hypothetical protein [Nitrospinaceae bacterium]
SKTRELPVLLSDQIRREIPFLDLLAANLRPLILFGPLILAIMTGLVISQQWDIVLKYLNAVPFNEVDPIFGRDISFYMFSLPMIQ